MSEELLEQEELLGEFWGNFIQETEGRIDLFWEVRAYSKVDEIWVKKTCFERDENQKNQSNLIGYRYKEDTEDGEAGQVELFASADKPFDYDYPLQEVLEIIALCNEKMKKQGFSSPDFNVEDYKSFF